MRDCGILTVVFLALTWTASWAVTIEVPGDYPSIQPAIDAAASGDTVLVAAGTYAGTSNRELDFGGKTICVVAAEGAGSTIIDCQRSGRAFYLHSGERAGATIDGFTIFNGYADHGGGVRCENGSSLTIQRCVIRNNEAYYGGGGVSCSSAGHVTLQDVVLSNNVAYWGGGLISASSGLVMLKDCKLAGNSAAFTGGARFEASPATLVDVTFSGNSGSLTVGGMSCFDSDDYNLTSVVFLDNSAPVCGGFGGARSTAMLKNCTFALNSSPQGGAVNCGPSSEFNLQQCILAFQTSGGAIFCEPGSMPTITHCCVYGNTGGDALCGTYWDNINTDPLLCDVSGGNVYLDGRSPCLPGGNAWGQLIGALGHGCGPSSTERASWSAVKAMFR